MVPDLPLHATATCTYGLLLHIAASDGLCKGVQTLEDTLAQGEHYPGQLIISF